ncbi:MAG: calcium sensor EFh [Actinoallomurus sp.]|jgi:hypothetical protein|nr:calcium sensor EFh [Actinoallomurus sp.]
MASEFQRSKIAGVFDPMDADEIFPLLDLNGDGYLSRDEFTRLWTQFWVGDDPEAPGTWVFGRFELPMPHGR